jgi:hypothetical protein
MKAVKGMGKLRGAGARPVLAVGAAACLVMAGAGAALASGNSVHVHVPARVRPEKKYRVTVHGFAARQERLYLFIDVAPCAKNPYVEHYKHDAPGDFWTVKGAFRESSGWIWRSSKPVTDHACAYLQAASRPLNSAGGVLGRSHVAYHIH